MINRLYYGDNLEVLRTKISDDSVDLIYLDPPFNSNETYNILFAERSGAKPEAQVRAFEDTWKWDAQASIAYQDTVQGKLPKLSVLMQGLMAFLGNSNMMAYLCMMAVRLAELQRVLKTKGNIFLHCDSTSSHYLKLVMDSIFDPLNFRNEIIWKRSQPKSHVSKRFSRAHDVILWYSKSDLGIFKQQYIAYDQDYIDKFYRFTEPDTGRRYTLADLTNPNKNRPNLTYEFPEGSGMVRVWRWTKDRMILALKEGRIIVPENGGVPRFKRYLDEMSGVPVTDIWDDIEHLHGSHQESLGFQTQKPVALLNRIILSTTNVGDVVLDPFCGCGTTIAAAEQNGRKWLGIDITHVAIQIIRERLQLRCKNATYEVVGLPKDIEGARELASHNRIDFQRWIIGLIDAHPGKIGPDGGIDGWLYFFDNEQNVPRKAIVQVKSGKNKLGELRDFLHVVSRERAELGIYVTLEEPTGPMRREVLEAGSYKSNFLGAEQYLPKIQLLTVQEVLDGKRVQLPTSQPIKPTQVAKASRARKLPAEITTVSHTINPDPNITN